MSTFSRCGNCNQKINRVLFSLRITNVCKVKRFQSTWYQENSIFLWHTLYFKCFVNKIHIQVGNNNGMSPYNFHVKRESASKSRFDFHISECTCTCMCLTQWQWFTCTRTFYSSYVRKDTYHFFFFCISDAKWVNTSLYGLLCHTRSLVRVLSNKTLYDGA